MTFLNTLTACLFFALVHTASMAQNPDLISDRHGAPFFSKSWSAGGYCYFQDVKVLPNGGYVACGSAKGLWDGRLGALLRFDGDGSLLWDLMLPERSQLNRIHPNADGSFLVVGETTTSSVFSDMLLMKVAESGDFLWGRTLNLGAGSGDWLEGVAQDADGNFFLYGIADSGFPASVVLAKMDADGNLLWLKKSVTDQVLSPNGAHMVLHQGRDPILSIPFWSSGTSQIHLAARVDGLNGKTLWCTRIGDQTLGHTHGLAGSPDGLFVALLGNGLSKFDGAGQVFWRRRFDLPQWWIHYFSNLVMLPDGDMVFSDEMDDHQFDFQGYEAPLIRISPEGEVRWARTVPGCGSKNGTAIARAPDGGFVFAGHCNPDTFGQPFHYWLAHTDAEGRMPGCRGRELDIQFSPYDLDPLNLDFAWADDPANFQDYDPAILHGDYTERDLCGADVPLDFPGALGVCSDDTIHLHAPAGFKDFHWSTGSTDAFLVVGAPDTFLLTAVGQCGIREAMAVVGLAECPARLQFPNAFTPNGDGHNDLFLPVGDRVRVLELAVFSRWGEMVFRTFENDAGWDGRYRGKDAPSDVYVFRCRYLDLETGLEKSARGEVALLR